MPDRLGDSWSPDPAKGGAPIAKKRLRLQCGICPKRGQNHSISQAWDRAGAQFHAIGNGGHELPVLGPGTVTRGTEDVMASNMDDYAIVIADRAGAIQFMSAGAEAMLGHSARDAVGQ